MPSDALRVFRGAGVHCCHMDIHQTHVVRTNLSQFGCLTIALALSLLTRHGVGWGHGKLLIFSHMHVSPILILPWEFLCVFFYKVGHYYELDVCLPMPKTKPKYGLCQKTKSKYGLCQKLNRKIVLLSRFSPLSKRKVDRFLHKCPRRHFSLALGAFRR